MLVIVFLGVQDAMGMAFGIAVILWSVWLVYYWAIKPDREGRRRLADQLREEMHKRHWEHWNKPL